MDAQVAAGQATFRTLIARLCTIPGIGELRGRHGAKKAICAVAASILTATSHILKDGTEHQDLGADHPFHREKAKRLAAQIKKLGFEIEIRPLPEAA